MSNEAASHKSATRETAGGDGIETTHFGVLPDGRPVHLYTIRSGGQVAQFTDFGARVVALFVPDRDGRLEDVVFGYADFAGYMADNRTYCGSTVGRYANRLAEGRFSLDGVEYRVPRNNGENALHGGPEGFDRRLWQGTATGDGVEFRLVSPAGDQGFPGELTVTVRYGFARGRLQVDFEATSDAATVVNITHHAYFNLAGESAGSILDHVLELPAAHFTAVDGNLIPTGELAEVEGTPFDFRSPRRVGDRIDNEHVQLERGLGYDHTWAMGEAGQMKLAARLSEPRSGRVMTVETTEPGVQFYTGNHLDGSNPNRAGGVYGRRTGLCLETQHYPDSPNHAQFPTTVLRPGKRVKSRSVFTFTAS